MPCLKTSFAISWVRYMIFLLSSLFSRWLTFFFPFFAFASLQFHFSLTSGGGGRTDREQHFAEVRADMRANGETKGVVKRSTCSPTPMVDEFLFQFFSPRTSSSTRTRVGVAVCCGCFCAALYFLTSFWLIQGCLRELEATIKMLVAFDVQQLTIMRKFFSSQQFQQLKKNSNRNKEKVQVAENTTHREDRE